MHPKIIKKGIQKSMQTNIKINSQNGAERAPRGAPGGALWATFGLQSGRRELSFFLFAASSLQFRFLGLPGSPGTPPGAQFRAPGLPRDPPGAPFSTILRTILNLRDRFCEQKRSPKNKNKNRKQQHINKQKNEKHESKITLKNLPIVTSISRPEIRVPFRAGGDTRSV